MYESRITCIYDSDTGRTFLAANVSKFLVVVFVMLINVSMFGVMYMGLNLIAVCMCACVCVYVSMYLCIYVSMRVCVYVRACVRVYHETYNVSMSVA